MRPQRYVEVLHYPVQSGKLGVVTLTLNAIVGGLGVPCA